jgi:hypothetical protein
MLVQWFDVPDEEKPAVEAEGQSKGSNSSSMTQPMKS